MLDRVPRPGRSSPPRSLLQADNELAGVAAQRSWIVLQTAAVRRAATPPAGECELTLIAWRSISGIHRLLDDKVNTARSIDRHENGILGVISHDEQIFNPLNGVLCGVLHEPRGFSSLPVYKERMGVFSEFISYEGVATVA